MVLLKYLVEGGSCDAEGEPGGTYLFSGQSHRQPHKTPITAPRLWLMKKHPSLPGCAVAPVELRASYPEFAHIAVPQADKGNLGNGPWQRDFFEAGLSVSGLGYSSRL